MRLGERGAARQKRAAQHPVLDDEAQRMIADELVVVMEEEARVSVGHADLADRLGLGFDLGPDAERAQHLLRAPGERGRAAVIRRIEKGCGPLAFDERGLDPGACGGKCQRRTGQPAADDQKLDAALGHGPSMEAAARAVQPGKKKPERTSRSGFTSKKGSRRRISPTTRLPYRSHRRSRRAPRRRQP